MLKAFSILWVVLLAIFTVAGGGQGLVAQGSEPEKGQPVTKLTTKDNDHEVLVRGNRFLVELPHRSQYQWKPLPASNSSELTPTEIVELRKFVTDSTHVENLGGGQMQVSTFKYPEVNSRKVKLELVYTDRLNPSEAPKNGDLYKPEGADLTIENNRPKPNMRFVVRLKRE